MVRNPLERVGRKLIERKCCIHLELVYVVNFSKGVLSFFFLFFGGTQRCLMFTH